MTRRPFSDPRILFLTVCLLVLLAAPGCTSAAPTPAAVSAFNSYIEALESRLAQQHGSRNAFLAGVASNPQNNTKLRRGELIIDQLTPNGGAVLPGALLHDWRGTAFVRGAKAADFQRLMKNFHAYPRVFFPQVLQSKVLMQQGDRFQVQMRVRQRHVITVVMDTTYDVTFEQLDANRGYSISRSTRISEIESSGTGAEHALNSNQEHGFMWRLNTYWSYEERDGGLYMQIESVSLSRSIPNGLGWVVQPFIESVPRESLEFTLRSVCSALRK